MQDFEHRLKKMHMGRLIHMLSSQMKRSQQVEQVIAEDLTVMQKHVLKFILLETLHRDLYQKDIEEEFQIRKSTVTGILKLMEKNGFIHRECAPQDGRLKKIVPTKKAEALRADILKNIQKTEQMLTEGISEKDVKICKHVMCQMFCNLVHDSKEVVNKDE